MNPVNRKGAREEEEKEDEVQNGGMDYRVMDLNGKAMARGKEKEEELQPSSSWRLQTVQSSALPVTNIASAYPSADPHLSQFPIQPSGIIEAGASSIATFSTSSDLAPAIEVPRLSTGLDLSDLKRSNFNQAENAATPIPSWISPLMSFPSSDPSICVTEPPPVPESIPRDPVPQAGRGEGWPYAPQGWPNSDDKWGWRVGRRAGANSLWLDRYVSVPKSLVKGRRAAEFASRKSLAEYLKQNFPHIDAHSIFKAFDWKVPAPKQMEASNKRGSTAKRDKPPPTNGDVSWPELKKQCQAGNPNCLLVKGKNSGSQSFGSLACNICCSEPGFCRECKCILCCRYFLPDADEFTVIRCHNFPLAGESVCGHAAHLECALASQLAGVRRKYGLDMEYICRRCDRKTDLKETFSRLVEVMGNMATQSKVENVLQIALRILQDPEDKAHTFAKSQEILIGDALRKVQMGGDIVESYKVLTEQLKNISVRFQAGQGVYDSQVSNEVQNWSRAMGQNRTLEDVLRHTETSLDKWLPQSRSPGSGDAPATPFTFQVQDNSQPMPDVSTRQGGLNDTSPATDMKVNTTGGSEARGVATTGSPRLQPVLNVDKNLPSTSLQSSPMPEDQVLSVITPLTSSEILPFTPLLADVLDQSVWKPPTLSIDEHIRQCEAMTNRVKGAGLLNTPPSTVSITSPGNLKVVLKADLEPPSSPTGSLSAKCLENETSAVVIHGTGSSACSEELVTCIPSSPCPSNSQDAGGYEIASTKIRKVYKLSSIEPPIISSLRVQSPCLTNLQAAGGDDIANTGTTEASKPPSIEPPTIFGCDVAPGTHAAGLEAEFEDQIGQALEKLRSAQAAEYARAEESLHAQKKTVVELYLQLEKVCRDFVAKERAQPPPHQSPKGSSKARAQMDHAISRVLTQYEKAQEGQQVYESMLAISNGFGQVSKDFLLKFFNWPPHDTAEA